MIYRLECNHFANKLIAYRASIEGIRTLVALEFLKNSSELTDEILIEFNSALQSHLDVYQEMLSGETFWYNTWRTHGITWYGKPISTRSNDTIDKHYIKHIDWILQIKIEFIDPDTIK